MPQAPMTRRVSRPPIASRYDSPCGRSGIAAKLRCEMAMRRERISRSVGSVVSPAPASRASSNSGSRSASVTGRTMTMRFLSYRANPHAALFRGRQFHTRCHSERSEETRIWGRSRLRHRNLAGCELHQDQCRELGAFGEAVDEKEFVGAVQLAAARAERIH